jgi:hypothetical protein
MFLYVVADLVQLGRAESEIGGERNGLEPELCFEIVAGDVDVRRLVVLPTVEVKSVGTDAKNRWHGGGLAARRDDRSHPSLGVKLYGFFLSPPKRPLMPAPSCFTPSAAAAPPVLPMSPAALAVALTTLPVTFFITAKTS